MEKIEIKCLCCGCSYTGQIIIESGDIEPKFCSEECYENYYKKIK